MWWRCGTGSEQLRIHYCRKSYTCPAAAAATIVGRRSMEAEHFSGMHHKHRGNGTITLKWKSTCVFTMTRQPQCLCLLSQINSQCGTETVLSRKEDHFCSDWSTIKISTAVCKGSLVRNTSLFPSIGTYVHHFKCRFRFHCHTLYFLIESNFFDWDWINISLNIKTFGAWCADPVDNVRAQQWTSRQILIPGLCKPYISQHVPFFSLTLQEIVIISPMEQHSQFDFSFGMADWLWTRKGI